METRANYILIGLFTIVGILGALGFFVWLAKVQVDRQYAYYDILFQDVSGLGRAGDVRYNGLPIGQVVDLALSEDDPNLVRVRIEVAADTPIRTDTVAQLNAQGVTGVAYVGLSGGSQDAPLLASTTEGVPVIRAERSVVQALTEDAPDVMAELLALLQNLEEISGTENRELVSNILQNVERSSAALDTALEDFSDISRSVAEATDEISKFTGRLEGIGNAVETTLGNADVTLQATTRTLGRTEVTLEAATSTLGSVERTFDSADRIITERVPGIIDEAEATLRGIDTAVARVSTEAEGTIRAFGETAATANARLAELEATIAGVDTLIANAGAALDAVEGAARGLDGLVTGEGAALIASAGAALDRLDAPLAELERIAVEDVPTIMADIRAATATANATMAKLGEDLSGLAADAGALTEDARGALAVATRTFSDASATLARLERTMEAAETALASADTAFGTADRILTEQAAPTAESLRVASASIETAMERVSTDLPEITAELRAMIDRASGVVDSVDEAVAAASPAVTQFALAGLPQYSLLAREARELIVVLERLSTSFERDPARFLFGNTPAELNRR